MPETANPVTSSAQYRELCQWEQEWRNALVMPAAGLSLWLLEAALGMHSAGATGTLFPRQK